MAETDILNPQTGHWAPLGDNPNPSYGFTRKTNSNPKLGRARLGSWYQRDNANDGYSFTLTYVNRPWSTMLRLKQFYEIGKSGYFTLIDYDGGGRHHVGRFTSAPDPIQVANGKYNCQNLVFEEIPQARMLSYPSDFVNWSRTINVVDDFLNCQVAYQGAWHVQVQPFAMVVPAGGLPSPVGIAFGGEDPTSPANYELYASAAAAGDYAQLQYVGFGFQMTFRLNSDFGTWDIVVDGQTLVTALNLTLGTATSTQGYTPVNSPVSLAAPSVSTYVTTQTGSFVIVQCAQMPLDAHRVKIVRNHMSFYEMPNSVIGFEPENTDPSIRYGGFFKDLGSLPVAFPAVVVIV